MELRKLVYLAGPISNGGTLPVDGRRANMVAACGPAVELLRAGCAVIIPQCTQMVDEICPDAVDQPTWVESCLPQVAASDCVLRLPGESAGSDIETAFAESRGIPVVYSVADALEAVRRPPDGYLETAIKITSGARQNTYGHPYDNHGTTGALWTAWLRRKWGFDSPEITAEDVCSLNILQKMSREAGLHHDDNWVDVAGYTRNVEMIRDRREYLKKIGMN